MKGTAPTIPSDAVKIEVPCAKTKMLARVELKGTPAVAKRLQEEFTLTVPDGINKREADRRRDLPECRSGHRHV